MFEGFVTFSTSIYREISKVLRSFTIPRLISDFQIFLDPVHQKSAKVSIEASGLSHLSLMFPAVPQPRV